MLPQHIQKVTDPVVSNPSDSQNTNPGQQADIVVIGSGPVGMRFVKHVLDYEPEARIVVYGNEPFAPYNRVQLSSLLAGDIKREQIDIPLPAAIKHPHFCFDVATITGIDRDRKLLVDNQGGKHPYKTLVIATGARAYIPNIPGNSNTGVFSFRNLSDAENLLARITRCRQVVVVGGGLLGIEAAKALLRAGTQVTLIQQGPHLMNRQLDEEASMLLQTEVERLGIKVITHSGVREIIGTGRVESVRTYNGEIISCDTVLLCAGIQANMEIARQAKLSVGRGITVNDILQTSDPDIYAIGECCEHEGRLYGLVNPGFEQAAVAASVICRGTASYKGSQSVSRLKVLGQDVCSMGDVVELHKHPFQREIRYLNSKAGCYRKLVLLRGRLQGVIGFGKWPEANRVQSLFQDQATIYPWQRWLFRLSGRLWLNPQSASVSEWPGMSIVCQCNNVSKAELCAQIDAGCQTLGELQLKTGASTVCGSCKPLIAELSGSHYKSEKENAWLVFVLCSIVTLVGVGLQLFWPEARVADSVQQNQFFESIWNNNLYKQITGFSLLSLTVIALFMSLRKRLNVKWMGKFAFWRGLHTTLGTLCVLFIILHTGFHLGNNLNQLLMIDFLAVLVLGSGAGLIIGTIHKIKPDRAKGLRQTMTWFHILITWPLPALLAAHILSVYYF